MINNKTLLNHKKQKGVPCTYHAEEDSKRSLFICEKIQRRSFFMIETIQMTFLQACCYCLRCLANTSDDELSKRTKVDNS